MEKILVVGSLNMDLVVNVAVLPRRGETILGGVPAHIPGGKGANQAYAAAKLGGCVAMLGMVGDDAHGQALLASLRTVGVGVSHIAITKKAPTGIAIVYVEESGGNCIVVASGANALCDVAYIRANEEAIASHDILVAQMEIPHDAVYEAIRLAKKHRKRVLLNPAPAPKSLSASAIGGIDFLLPNESELETLSAGNIHGGGEAVAAARRLIKQGVNAVLVTMGESGALLVDADTDTMAPTRKVKAVDTTAAGDTFVGGFAAALAEGKSVGDAITFANAAAALSVTKKGAQSSIPSLAELREAGD